MEQDDKSSEKSPNHKPEEFEITEEPAKNKDFPISEVQEKSIIPSGNKKPISTGIIIALVAIVAIAAFFAGSYFSNINSDSVTKSDLDSAVAKLEAKIASIPTSGQPTQPTQPIKISLDDDPIIGNPDAPITILEFSDFQCPFCARFYVQTLPAIKEEYIDTGKVNFVYRDFPIQSIHPNALPAAVASECANEQGKYWEYHDILFENQSSWAKLDTNTLISTFSEYANKVGLNQEQFDACLETGKYLEEIQQDLNDGRDYEVTGTPGFFIGNEKIGFVKLSGAQPFESFKKVIDAQLGS